MEIKKTINKVAQLILDGAVVGTQGVTVEVTYRVQQVTVDADGTVRYSVVSLMEDGSISNTVQHTMEGTEISLILLSRVMADLESTL